MKCFIAMLMLQDIVKTSRETNTLNIFSIISRKEKIYSLLSSAKYCLQKDFYYFANLYIILKNNRNVREKFLKLKISWKISKCKNLYIFIIYINLYIYITIQDICIVILMNAYCYKKDVSYLFLIIFKFLITIIFSTINC